MDEFRTKQTNPYSNPPEPPKQQVNFSPRPDAPVAAQTAPHQVPVTSRPEPTPQPIQVEAEVAPAQASNPEPETTFSPPETQPTLQTPIVQAMDVVTPKPKRKVPKVLIFLPIGLILLSTIGGGAVVYQRKIAELSEKASKTAQQGGATIAATDSAETGGLGLSVGSIGTDEENGEVAGVDSDDAASNSLVYNGQVVLREDQLLVECYVDTFKTGQLEEVWISYGGSKTALNKDSKKTTEDLTESTEGIVQAIAFADLKDFEAGNSYMYQVNVKVKSGKVYKSGLAVFTIPKPDNKQQNQSSSTGSPL